MCNCDKKQCKNCSSAMGEKKNKTPENNKKPSCDHK